MELKKAARARERLALYEDTIRELEARNQYAEPFRETMRNINSMAFGSGGMMGVALIGAIQVRTVKSCDMQYVSKVSMK